MTESIHAHDEIRSLLQRFQDGYARRYLTQVDSFMELFMAEAEVIGTNGVRPGVDEWYMDRAAAHRLVEGDWEGWKFAQMNFSFLATTFPTYA